MSTVAEHLARALRSLPRADKAKVIDELLEDTDFREATAELLVKKLTEPKGTQKIKSSPNNVTSKERGRLLRESYISELKQNGILIEQFDRLWSETAKGFWVAIPTATMEWRLGRWFLGLPEDKVRERINKGRVVIILLCQSAAGSRLDFVIPPNIVERIVDKLSKSKGQLKFNVKTVGNRYYLVIPDDNNIDISDYKGGISILQE